MIRKSITFEAAGREPAGSSESLDADALKDQMLKLDDAAWKAEHGEQITVLKQEALHATLPNIYAIEDDKHETDLSISYRIGVRDSFSKLSMKDTVKFLTEAVQSSPTMS